MSAKKKTVAEFGLFPQKNFQTPQPPRNQTSIIKQKPSTKNYKDGEKMKFLRYDVNVEDICKHTEKLDNIANEMKTLATDFEDSAYCLENKEWESPKQYNECLKTITDFPYKKKALETQFNDILFQLTDHVDIVDRIPAELLELIAESNPEMVSQEAQNIEDGRYENLTASEKKFEKEEYEANTQERVLEKIA